MYRLFSIIINRISAHLLISFHSIYKRLLIANRITEEKRG